MVPRKREAHLLQVDDPLSGELFKRCLTNRVSRLGLIYRLHTVCINSEILYFESGHKPQDRCPTQCGHEQWNSKTVMIYLTNFLTAPFYGFSHRVLCAWFIYFALPTLSVLTLTQGVHLAGRLF